MKNSIRVSLLATCLLFAACGTAYKSMDTSKQEGFSVNDYKSFGIRLSPAQDSDTVNNELANKKLLVANIITDNLSLKGLIESADPELMLNLSVDVQQKTQTRTTDFRTDGLPKYIGQRRYSWKSQQVEVGKYQEGVFIIELVDTKNDKLVWRSGVKAVLPQDSRKAQSVVANALNELMLELK